MRKIPAMVTVSILLLMSLSSAIEQTRELNSDSIQMRSGNNVPSPLHLVDDSLYSETVNGMDYDDSGNLYYGGSLCGRSSTEVSSTFECELTSQSGTETTLSFTPSYVAVMDNEGIRIAAHLFHSGYGDRIDEIIVLENGDVLVAGGFCWLSNECLSLIHI